MTTKEKTVTARDLKTFIEAVEFATDTDEWVPSARQWKKIREMIDKLEEVAPAPARPPVQMAPPAMALPSPQYAAPARMAPGGMGGPQGGPLPAFGVGQTGALKTPDIDTSNGNYQSAFT